MTSSSRCSAKNPATCRYHGRKGSRVGDFTAYQFRREAEGSQQTPALVPLSETVHVTATKFGEEWQHAWLKDELGRPAVFVKTHLTKLVNDHGETVFEGVVLCDIEVNPALRKQGHTLEAFRKLKKHYGVDTLWCGTSFSESGYAMFKKLEKHEAETGEALLTLQPWCKSERIHPVPDDYSFVSDWGTMTARYPL